VAIELNSDLLNYLVESGCQEGDRLPAIPALAETLGISTGKLREQLEVARTMGLVEVKPKTGMRLQRLDFLPMLRSNLLYAMALEPTAFAEYGALRNHIEAAFWHEAVASLGPEDVVRLRRLVESAWRKLRGSPIQIPHEEHRQLHLGIYCRLENMFVKALLEAYWDAYESVGLNLYTDYRYLQQVWTYHDRMVEAIEAGRPDLGHEVLIEHAGLLQQHPEMIRARARLTADQEAAELPEIRRSDPE
jgi:DNA-binding FadR family transcriptional regulator